MKNVTIFALYWFFFLCTVINISLMLFNLLPIFPLDGFNLLVSFTKPNNRYMNFVRENSMWVLMGVMIVLIFTGWMAAVRDGIFNMFLSFWGTMF
jgi:Zn-dependent protease